MTSMKEKGYRIGVNASAKTSHTQHSSKTGCTSSAFYQHVKEQTKTPTKNVKSPYKMDEDREAHVISSGKASLSNITGLKQIKLISIKKAKTMVMTNDEGTTCRCAPLSPGCEFCTNSAVV